MGQHNLATVRFIHPEGWRSHREASSEAVDRRVREIVQELRRTRHSDPDGDDLYDAAMFDEDGPTRT
jgi:hypothetical protein